MSWGYGYDQYYKEPKPKISMNSKMFLPKEGERYEIYTEEVSEKSDEAQNTVNFETGQASIIGQKRRNEDEWISVHNNEFQLFGVMDGHVNSDSYEDGSAASKYFKLNYENILLEIIQKNPEIKSQDAIKKACEKIEEFVLQNYSCVGTTLAAVMIRNDRAIIHHIGDSRVIVGTKDGRIIESIDHVPNLHCEYHKFDEILPCEFNGQISYRVSSGLAMSRAIGDKLQKQKVSNLTAIPDFQTIPLSDIKWILCLSDGPLECFSSKDIIEIVDTMLYKDISQDFPCSNLVKRLINFCRYKKLDLELQQNNEKQTKFQLISEIINDFAFQCNSCDNCTAIFTAIADYELYPPVEYNALKVEITDVTFMQFYETFPFPRLISKEGDSFIVLDNSSYTRLLIKHKFLNAPISEILLSKDEKSDIAYKCYNLLKPVEFSLIFFTQQFTKDQNLDNSLKDIGISKVGQRLYNQRDCALYFPRYQKYISSDKSDQVEEIFKQLSIFDIPPVITFVDQVQINKLDNLNRSTSSESSVNESYLPDSDYIDLDED